MHHKSKIIEESKLFCKPDCYWLSPTEKEQNTMNVPCDHMCGKYGVILHHCGHEPKILKCIRCEIHMHGNKGKV